MMAAMMGRLVALFLTAAIGASAAAEPAPARARAIALVGGTLIDGNGGPPLHNSVVLVQGERISAIGQVGKLAVPEGAEVISTEGMSVLPGLWDMHVHLMINGHADYAHWDRTYVPKPVLKDVIMPASAHQLLLAGVTSARDLGAPLEASRSPCATPSGRGKIPGPTLYVSGPFLQHRPYPGTEAFRWGVNGAADARAKVRTARQRRRRRHQAHRPGRNDHGGGPRRRGGGAPPQAAGRRARAPPRGDPARPCRRRGLFRAHRPRHRAGVSRRRDRDAARADWREARPGRSSGRPPSRVCSTTNTSETTRRSWTIRSWHLGLTPAIIDDIRRSIGHPERLSYFQITPSRRPTLARKFQQLRESGVMLLVGTDSGIPMKFHSQSTWNELDVWVTRLGVDPMFAIRAATYWPAVAMKVDKDVGTLTEGKLADIIAVRGDVLRYIALLQRVDIVIKRGKRYK